MYSVVLLFCGENAGSNTAFKAGGFLLAVSRKLKIYSA